MKKRDRHHENRVKSSNPEYSEFEIIIIIGAQVKFKTSVGDDNQKVLTT